MVRYTLLVVTELFLLAVYSGDAEVLTVLLEPSWQLTPWQGGAAQSSGRYNKSEAQSVTSGGNARDSGSHIVIGESDIGRFYNDFYTKSNSLTVFIDLRKEACPLDLFPRRLLGYLRMSVKHCTELSVATAAATATVDTWSFDLMSFMTSFLATVAQPGAEHLEAQFALFFDESGEDHFLLPSRNVTKKLMFEITLPLTNCSHSEQVTNLAAKTNIKDVVVIATTQCIYDLMLAISRLHLPTTRFRWLLYATDDTSNFNWSGVIPFFDSISPIFLRERERPANRPVFSSSKLFQFANEAAVRFLLDVQNNTTNHDCFPDCTSDCSSCQRLFKYHLTKIPGQMLEVFTADSQHEKRSILFDLYRITSNGRRYLGNWSEDTGIAADEPLFDPSFIDSRLSVVVIVEPPFVFRNVSESGVISYYGYSIDVFDKITKRVGVKYAVSECEEGGYGLLQGGRWTGCIGNVVRGEADVILGALTVTAERDKVIDFTLPYYNFAGIQILMKKQTVNTNLFYYANVFTTHAWASFAAVFVATSVLLWAFEKWKCSEKDEANFSVNAGLSTCPGLCKKGTYRPNGSRKVEIQNDSYKNNASTIDNAKAGIGVSMGDGKESSDVVDESVAPSTLGHSLWYVAGAITMSGGGDPPKSLSGRLLIAGFWFFAVIMMSTFTANLAAFLTVSRLGMTITSLEDLSRQSEVKYSVVNQSAVMEYFQRMARIETDFYERWKTISLDKTPEDDQASLAVWDYPLGNKYGAMWKTIQNNGLLASNAAGLERVKSENFALITETPIVQYYTSSNCDLLGIGEQFSRRPYSIGFKERSPYTDTFSAYILDLQKELELSSLRLRWWASSKVTCPKETANTGLDLYSLSGTFILTGAGIVSGFILLGLEHVVTHVKRRQKAKKTDLDVVGK
ncbi:hypothetical protein BsWGS_05777 [Bradybaena similaris]